MMKLLLFLFYRWRWKGGNCSRTKCWDSKTKSVLLYSSCWNSIYIARTWTLLQRDQLLQKTKSRNTEYCLGELTKSMSVFKSKTVKSTRSHIPQWELEPHFTKLYEIQFSFYSVEKNVSILCLHNPHKHEIFWNKQHS